MDDERKPGKAEAQRVPMGLPGYLPDHDEERRLAFQRSTPAERLAEAISISRLATRLAAGGAAARDRR